MADERVTPTPENPIPDVDEIKPGIPTPAWPDEGGSGGGGAFVVNTVEGEELTLDKTWQKIKDAHDAGSVVMLYDVDSISYLIAVAYLSLAGKYSVSFMGFDGTSAYNCSAATDYPVFDEG